MPDMSFFKPVVRTFAASSDKRLSEKINNYINDLVNISNVNTDMINISGPSISTVQNGYVVCQSITYWVRIEQTDEEDE